MTRRTRNTTSVKRDLIDAVAQLLGQARSVLFITGPSLSGDSGLASYRGIPGLVKRKPTDGKQYEAALSIDMMSTKPEVSWKYLLAIDEAVRAVKPNRGHEVLAQLERSLARSTIMTINVDRLHQRAGSRNVIEMHGALHDLVCKRCELSSRHERYDSLPMPPRCAVCHGTLRPDMPLFGEPLPADPFTQLQNELDQGFEMVFAIGVGKMYSYLARPMLLAKQDGIPTVEIGNDHTDLSDVVDFRFKGSPSKVLETLGMACQQIGRLSKEKLR